MMFCYVHFCSLCSTKDLSCSTTLLMEKRMQHQLIWCAFLYYNNSFHSFKIAFLGVHADTYICSLQYLSFDF